MRHTRMSYALRFAFGVFCALMSIAFASMPFIFSARAQSVVPVQVAYGPTNCFQQSAPRFCGNGFVVQPVCEMGGDGSYHSYTPLCPVANTAPVPLPSYPQPTSVSSASSSSTSSLGLQFCADGSIVAYPAACPLPGFTSSSSSSQPSNVIQCAQLNTVHYAPTGCHYNYIYRIPGCFEEELVCSHSFLNSGTGGY